MDFEHNLIAKTIAFTLPPLIIDQGMPRSYKASRVNPHTISTENYHDANVGTGHALFSNQPTEYYSGI
jgi:hypothetical protein